MAANILILDIETTPNIAYVWRFFKENVGADQVIKNSEILSYAAKWLGKKDIYYDDRLMNNEKGLLLALVHLLDLADIVVAHYGRRFDLPRINARCLALGIKPPSPYKIVDTKEIASKHFLFDANNLKHLANVLGCAPKLDHNKFPGFKLWLECLKGNPEAYEELEIYNKQDVLTLEEIYLKMRPWMPHHPNVAVFEEEVVCPKCGGNHYHRRGFYYSNSGRYQRYQCNSCGGWFRTRYMEKQDRKNLPANAI